MISRANRREKLLHCSTPWRGETERRTAFLKYTPFGCHHIDTGYAVAGDRAAARAAGWSEEQLRMVAMPERWLTAPAGDERRHDHVRHYQGAPTDSIPTPTASDMPTRPADAAADHHSTADLRIVLDGEVEIVPGGVLERAMMSAARHPHDGSLFLCTQTGPLFRSKVRLQFCLLAV